MSATYPPSSQTSREGVNSVLTQHKLDFSIHVLVVNRLTLFIVDSSSDQERLFVVASSPELVQDLLLSQDSVQHSACLLDIVLIDEHRAGDEFYVLHFGAFRCLAPILQLN